MSDENGIPRITDRNLSELVGAERAVLVLSTSDCGHCAEYLREIETERESGDLKDLSVGKMVLDRPGAAKFKQKNPWIGKLKTLPYTLVFARGKAVDHFATSRASYLVEKLEMEPAVG